MPQLLAFVGLIIGVTLYWLLVRRRVFARVTGIELGRMLSDSSQVALTRIREAPRRRADELAAIDSALLTDVSPERRSGGDRRGGRDPWRGRGRRAGGDRRRT